MFLRHLKVKINTWLDHLLHSLIQFKELRKLSIGVLMSAERIVMGNLKNGSLLGHFVHPRGKISNLVFK